MALTEISQEQGYREVVTDAFVLACDLGQSVDPTALCVLQHHRVQRQHWKGTLHPVSESFDVRYLQRLPLGLSYPEQVAAISDLRVRPPLNSGCALVIDETGVGRAVGDLFNASGMRPTRVTITAGADQTIAGLDRWHVPKQLLISGLDARLHTGELRFAADLHEAHAMADELKDFRRKVSVAGRYSYDARVGKHDDLVLAVALGLWFFAGRPKPPVAATGIYRTVR